MPKVTLTFDGGSRGNPGPAYGSFLVEARGLFARRLTRLTFGRGTNNEAEYWTLIAGLRDLLGELGRSSMSPGDVDLTVRGDSRLVLDQIGGKWKAKDARMRRLRSEVQELLSPFGSVRLAHQPRSRSVRQLGH